MKVSLTVGNLGTEERSLIYRPRNSSVAQRWVRCISRANTHSEIREANRWYNFDDKPQILAETLIDRIHRTIDQINAIYPGLVNEKIDPRHLQQSVNHLHVHFADSHLVRQRIDVHNLQLWNDFNNDLHALEGAIRDRSICRSDLPWANIVLTWKDSQREPLQNDDYSHFTVGKSFGAAYLAYCQVGRHLYELFRAQDDLTPDEHIRPLRSLSADTYFWFGPGTTEEQDRARLFRLQEWFNERRDRFERLGFRWGDPQLAVGWLPVADLEEDLPDFESKRNFVREMSRFDRVVRCEVIEE